MQEIIQVFLSHLLSHVGSEWSKNTNFASTEAFKPNGRDYHSFFPQINPQLAHSQDKVEQESHGIKGGKVVLVAGYQLRSLAEITPRDLKAGMTDSGNRATGHLCFSCYFLPPFCFVLGLIYLSERQDYRERERETERFLLPTGIHPRWPQWPGHCQAAARSSIQATLWVAGA